MSDDSSNQQIVDVMQRPKITAKVFAAKFKSKREIMTFLQCDVKCYLPAYGKCDWRQDFTSIWPIFYNYGPAI